MASVVAIVFGLVCGAIAWTRAEIHFDSQVREVLDLVKNDEIRDKFREELDLSAQQTMATAAIVAVALSGLSTLFVAATVIFTYDSSRQARRSLSISQRALDETLKISHRELMPYLVADISCQYLYDFEVDFSACFIIRLKLSNFGQTPLYIEQLKFHATGLEEFEILDTPKVLLIKKVIPSRENYSIDVTRIPDGVIEIMLHDSIDLILFISLKCSDIFQSREHTFNFRISADFGNYPERDQDEPSLFITADRAIGDNPLDLWIGATDGSTVTLDNA